MTTNMLSDTSKSMFLILLVAFISLATASYVLLQSDVPIALQIDYIYSPENNIGILNELGQIGVEVINHNNESFTNHSQSISQFRQKVNCLKI
jgi:hypothetical protein